MAVETVAKVAVATTAMAVLVGLIYWKFFMDTPPPYYPPHPLPYSPPAPGQFVEAQQG